jgi:hypothetical protein
MPAWLQFVLSGGGLGLLAALAFIYRGPAAAAERAAVEARLRRRGGGPGRRG